MSNRAEKRSTIFPLPSSPHCDPKIMTFPILTKPIHSTVVGQAIAFCRLLALAVALASLYLFSCTSFCRLGGTGLDRRRQPGFERSTMQFTRRDLGKIALASVPLCRASGAKMIDSKFGGVQIRSEERRVG